MAFLDRFFRRADQAPLPDLGALLEARGLPGELQGLAELKPEFDHLRDAAAREAWADAVAEVHTAGLPLPPAWKEAQYDLLPELVPAWRAEREGRWARLFIEGLSQRLLLPTHPEVGAIPAAWMRLWGVQPQEALETALDHLRQKSEKRSFERLPSGIYRSPWQDGHDAARLLLHEVWDPLFADQKPFFAIPDPSTLLVAPQILLPKLVEAVGPLVAGGAELQASLLERIHDQLAPARLQEPHPMAGAQKELRYLDQMEAFRLQDQDLALPPFAALGRACPSTLVRSKEGRLLSAAVWVEKIPALVPDVDLVGFISADGRALGLFFRQTLPRIQELKGEAVSIWGPRRVRYEGFPTEEQLERLERFATGEQMAAVLNPQGARQAPRPAAPAPGASAAPAPVQAPARPAHLRDVALGVQDEE